MTQSSEPEVPFTVAVTLERDDVVEFVRLSSNSRMLVRLSGLVVVPLLFLGREPGPPTAALLHSPSFAVSIFIVVSAYVFSPLVLGEYLWRRLPADQRRTAYRIDGVSIRPGARSPIPFAKVHHFRRSDRVIAIFSDERGQQGFALPVSAFATVDQLTWLDQQLAANCTVGRLRGWSRLDPLTKKILILWPLIAALFLAIWLLK